MAKRFGRNQKRAMRDLLTKAEDKIAGLGHQVRHREGDIKSLREELHKNDGLIDTILAVIPNHFCAVAASEFENVPDAQTRIELVKRLPPSARQFFGGNLDRNMYRSAMHHALDILRIDLDEDRDPINFREMQHVVVRFKSKYVALAVTPEALKYMPIEELARDVAVLIKQHLVGKNAKR